MSDVRSKHWMRWLAILSLVVLFTTTAQGQERQVLNGHVPRVVTSLNLQPIGPLPSETRLHLAIGLPLRNKEALSTLLQQIYDPASSQYHHYLTTEQFTEMFGPTEQDYQAVVAFAESQGFTVTTMYPNRLLLDVEGAASDVEKTFQVKMLNYQHPKEARTFYAPDVEPSVPSGIKILDISGISNYPRPHPMSHVGQLTSQASSPTPNSGSGPSGTYMGSDFRTAYVPGTSLNGSGQTIALAQWDGYLASDIAAYESKASLPSVTLLNILLNGFSGTPTGNGGEVEVSLDIEMVISMAPKVSKVIVYEGSPSDSSPNVVLSRIATDNLAKQISMSWGWSGGPSASTDNIFIQMISQGQSFFVASGDSDSYTNGAVDNSLLYGTPSDSTNVTSVGGTTLTTGGGGAYASEAVWNTRSWDVDLSAYLGSSGGISSHYAIPTWQQGVSMAANGGSTSYRNFPDVGLTATNVFVIADNDLWYMVSGTSCAAPLWAGFTALVNQQAAATGQSPVGFLNPALYAIGKSASYTNCFHDTTVGDNTSMTTNNPYGSTNQFYAVTGYDLCTGWGTPNGTNLINALAPLNPHLAVSPASTTNFGSVAIGQTSNLNFYAINTGGLSLSGTAASTSATPFSVTSGSPYTVAVGQTQTVTVTFTPVAGGTANGSVIFISTGGNSTNTVTGIGVCGCTLSSTNGAFGIPGGSGSFTVNAPGTCAWTPSTTNAWITLAGGGSGTGTVTYTVAANPVTNPPRQGTITVQDQTFTVTQEGNTAPQVSVAPVSPVTLPVLMVYLNATVTDDGAPYGTLSTTWSNVSGGSVVFGNVNATNTTATFSTNGTYVLRLTASDGALSTSKDVTVIVNAPPRISAPPSAINGLAQVNGLTVVAGDESACFTVGAYDPDGNPLSCTWDFGDNAPITGCNPCHVFTNDCGPYAVNVVVSDGLVSTNATSLVIVACQLTITKMQMKLNFAKLNADSVSLSGILDLDAGFNPASKAVTLNIGGAQVPFTLDAKGKGRGVSDFGSCKLAYNKKTLSWTLTANLAKGTWRTAWAAYGLENESVKPGTWVTMPVVVVISDDAFADERPVLYTATKDKSGSAK